MAELNKTQVLDSGVSDPTPDSASAGGDTFANTGKTWLEVYNGSGAQITVTIAASQQCNQGFSHNGGGTVANAATQRFGPFPTNRYGNTISVTWSDDTSVTVKCFEL